MFCQNGKIFDGDDIRADQYLPWIHVKSNSGITPFIDLPHGPTLLLPLNWIFVSYHFMHAPPA